MGKCVVCGDPARKGRRGPQGIVCGEECRAALGGLRQYVLAKRMSAGGAGSCVTCGSPTAVAVSSGRPFKYCSPSCRNRASARHGSLNLKKQCPECDCEFTSRNPGQKYCCADCRLEAERSRARANKNGGTHERRCRKYKTEYRRIDPMRIFERDGWLCQICLAPVDKDVVFPDQLAATLDHITPLSRGGDHIESNLQTAHWACNSAKRNTIPSEPCPAGDHQHQRQS
jgi:5-methylcytosine-specific restriction endonuclease McrA